MLLLRPFNRQRACTSVDSIYFQNLANALLLDTLHCLDSRIGCVVCQAEQFTEHLRRSAAMVPYHAVLAALPGRYISMLPRAVARCCMRQQYLKVRRSSSFGLIRLNRRKVTERLNRIHLMNMP